MANKHAHTHNNNLIEVGREGEYCGQFHKLHLCKETLETRQHNSNDFDKLHDLEAASKQADRA